MDSRQNDFIADTDRYQSQLQCLEECAKLVIRSFLRRGDGRPLYQLVFRRKGQKVLPIGFCRDYTNAMMHHRPATLMHGLQGISICELPLGAS